MGVIYKLKDEVIQFIISQRQSDPFSSCRQLAESASARFGLRLSKSSVHDVLKESGIISPRGRKPKNKFEIPQEKKKQIQESLLQVKLLPATIPPAVILSEEKDLNKINSLRDFSASGLRMTEGQSPQMIDEPAPEPIILPAPKEEAEISGQYEAAGKIFLKAALWDLGIFSGHENLKETDWKYYLTYAKGVKVTAGTQDFFIDLPLPIERCIREIVDGLVNNVKPLILYKVSDESLFRSCMEDLVKLTTISIVDYKDHEIVKFDNIVDCRRQFMIENRVFVENIEKDPVQRAKNIFFPQHIENDSVIDNILNLKGFDCAKKDENIVTLSIDDNHSDKALLQEAVEKFNRMYLRDGQNRSVSIQT